MAGTGAATAALESGTLGSVALSCGSLSCGSLSCGSLGCGVLGCVEAGAEIVTGTLHLGQAIFFPIRVVGTFIDASQLWQAILIFLVGSGVAGATGFGATACGVFSSGTSIGPLHFGHLIRLPKYFGGTLNFEVHC